MQAMEVSTAKIRIREILESLPEDSTYEEIIREMAFARMVGRGLEDARAGRLADDDEMGNLIKQWQS